MQKYLSQSLNNEVSKWINSNLKNYLIKNHENQSEIEHIIDYLNSDSAPKRLIKMSYSEANESAKRWLKTLIKKGHDVEETEDVDFDVIIDFKDGMSLIKLKTEFAFKREGSLMGHCVASYFNKQSSIYSLRDSKGMPHCTLEIDKRATSFNQCKGKGNGPIHHKYISYILKTFKHFDISIRSEEMRNLGYFYLDECIYSKEQINFFKEHFSNKEKLLIKDKTYYFMG